MRRSTSCICSIPSSARMITQTLKAEGPVINRKRVQCLMRLMGWRARRHNPQRARRRRTTPSTRICCGGHDRTAEPTDITYIHGARLEIILVLPPGPGVAAVQHAGRASASRR